jgi:hypothetical protein
LSNHPDNEADSILLFARVVREPGLDDSPAIMETSTTTIP